MNWCLNDVVLGRFLSVLSASLRITTCYRHLHCKLKMSLLQFFAYMCVTMLTDDLIVNLWIEVVDEFSFELAASL